MSISLLKPLDRISVAVKFAGLRALTLLHPWPYAIAHLGKRIENRTWDYPESLMGQWIALHGAKYPTGEKLRGAVYNHRVIQGITRTVAYAVPELPDFPECVIEGIFAVARIEGLPIVRSRDPWFFGPYGWPLTQVHVFKSPIPYRGAQKLWNVPQLVVERIIDAIPESEVR